MQEDLPKPAVWNAWQGYENKSALKTGSPKLYDSRYWAKLLTGKGTSEIPLCNKT